jgi:hypothetical protein
VFIASRVETTDALYRFFVTREKPPKVVINGSAIGYYGGGNGDDQQITEDGDATDSFSHQLCTQWEQSARQFESLGSRVCYLRTGIVLGQQGALQKMLPAFWLALGGPMGDGTQWMSWIHIDDMVNLMVYCIEQEGVNGPVNATAPFPVRNRDFSKTLGAVLNRPAVITLPKKIVTLLFGEMAQELLLQGKCVIPKKLNDMGFEFKYTQLKYALDDLLS